MIILNYEKYHLERRRGLFHYIKKTILKNEADHRKTKKIILDPGRGLKRIVCSAHCEEDYFEEEPKRKICEEKEKDGLLE